MAGPIRLKWFKAYMMTFRFHILSQIWFHFEGLMNVGQKNCETEHPSHCESQCSSLHQSCKSKIFPLQFRWYWQPRFYIVQGLTLASRELFSMDPLQIYPHLIPFRNLIWWELFWDEYIVSKVKKHNFFLLFLRYPCNVWPKIYHNPSHDNPISLSN